MIQQILVKIPILKSDKWSVKLKKMDEQMNMTSQLCFHFMFFSHGTQTTNTVCQATLSDSRRYMSVNTIQLSVFTYKK